MKNPKAKQDNSTLASRIRRKYILERDEHEATFHGGRRDYRPGPWWDGGLHKGVKRNPIWPKIAGHLDDAHIDDPGDFVLYLFEEARTPPPMPPVAPMPNHLLTKRYLDDYQRGLAQRRKDEIDRLRIHFCCMETTLRSGLVWWDDFAELVEVGELDCDGNLPSKHEIMASVLLDTSTQMNELFRHCVAVKCCRKLVGTFERMAAYKYVPNRDAYDIAWGKFIPEAFRLRADKLYEEVCQFLLRGR